MLWMNCCWQMVWRSVRAGSDWLISPRLVVLLGVLSAIGCLIAVERLNCLWLMLLVVAAAATPLAGRKFATATMLVLCPFIFWGYCLWRLPQPTESDLSRFAGKGRVIFRARVAEVMQFYAVDREPAGRGITGSGPESPCDSRVQLIVEGAEMLFPERRLLSGRSVATVYDARAVPAPGNLVEIKASISSLRARNYPWQFDYAKHMQRRGVFSQCQVSSLKVIDYDRESRDSCWLYLIDQISAARQRILVAHREVLGNEHGDLLSSMVLGERAAALPDELRRSFQEVGLAHVLAASGFNLAIVTGMTLWLGSCFIRNRLLLNGFCFFSMCWFVLLAGPSPSVVRATIMITVVLAAGCTHSRVHTLAALAAALMLTLLVDPKSVVDVGLQLSYLATAGIVCGAENLAKTLNEVFRLPSWLAQPIALITMAQLSVLPLQLYYFWQLGLLFLPANLLVEPIVPAITILGFISSILVIVDFSGGWLNPLIVLLDKIALCPLTYMLGIVQSFSSWETGKLHLGPPNVLWVNGFYLALLCLSISFRIRCFRLPSMMLIMLALWGLLSRPPAIFSAVVVVNHTLVLVNENRQAYCRGQADRFLAYMGAQQCRQSNCFSSVAHAGLTIVRCQSPAVTVLLIDDYGRARDFANQRIPLSQAVVLQGNCGAFYGAREELLKIIRISKAKWVICDWLGKQQLNSAAVAWLRSRLPDVNVVSPAYGCLLLSDCKQTGAKYRSMPVSLVQLVLDENRLILKRD